MKRVFVGLSGGVDSAVSAALLKQQGHEVVGAFIKIWRPEFTECTWKEDRVDAMRVCVALDIPFREVDLSDEYKKEVVDSMVRDYEQGITPNPDVLCNRAIKFGHFKKWALEQGAEMVATGHYARIEKRADSYHLLRGVDTAKDQSYFLHLLDQDDLAHALFPVGGYRKDEVRALAAKFELPVARKHDSQGLCFVGDITLSEFLARYIPLHRGAVLDMTGNVIGNHDGAALYTPGQRHGFSVRKSQPHYVVSVDVRANTVCVSPRRHDAARSEALVHDMHWIGEKQEGEMTAQGRYREAPFTAKISHIGKSTRIHLSEPRILAPGQSLVLYREDECLGGGPIARM